MSAAGARPLRLCFVSADYPTVSRGATGGIGAHSSALAHSLAGLGHEVTVLAETTANPQQSSDGPVTIQAISRGSTRQWKLGNWLPIPWLRWTFAVHRSLRQLQAERPFDLIVFPDAYGEGFRFSLSPSVPFVVRFGGPASIVQRWDGRHVPLLRARIEKWVEAVPAARAPILVCASRRFAEQVSREWSLDLALFRIVRNPLPIDKFRPAPIAVRRDRPTVLFVGRLQPLKGVRDLIEAIPTVAKQHPNALVDLVGSDTKTGPGNTSLRVQLEMRLHEHGVRELVKFREPVSHDVLVPLYQQCAVFVLPSHHDVYPNAVLEAMGCGRPCIVTNAVGTAELVTESRCGIVVPPNDPSALAAAICSILAMSEAERDAMGARGRRIVEGKCAASIVAIQAVEVYREAIERFHARHALKGT